MTDTTDEIGKRIMQITGHTSNLVEALDQWEQERVALAELHDENQALSIYINKALRDLALADKIILLLEKHKALVLPPAISKAFHVFKEAQESHAIGAEEAKRLSTYRLQQLRDAANEACRQAMEHKDEIHGAINWGDLGCVRAYYFLTEDGELGQQVEIEEASDDAMDLRTFIAKELKRFGEVHAVTRW